MKELLELCGIESKEAEIETPRIRQAFEILGISAEDIEHGVLRIKRYYDTELLGVRMILRLCMLDMVTAVLAKEEGEKKIIFGFMAPGFTVFSSALTSVSRQVYAGHLCERFQLVLGSIFNKIVPILEVAENRWLNAGKVSHCGNVKTLVGLFSLGLIPKPDLLVTSDYLCETAPKSIDMLFELDNIPKFYLSTCSDREFKEFPEATSRLTFFTAKNIRKFAQKLFDVVGFEIKDEILLDVLESRHKLGKTLGKIDDLVINSDPVPIHANYQTLQICLDSLPLSIDNLPDAITAAETLYSELKERVDMGIGVVKKGSPRILATLPPHYTDPRLDYLVAELGLAIVSTDNVFSARKEETLKDPYEQLAYSHLRRSFPCGLKKRAQITVEGCRNLKVEGILDRIHVGCRTVAGDALLLKDSIANNLGIPVVLLERDDFDPRTYDQQQYKNQLELLKTMIINNSK